MNSLQLERPLAARLHYIGLRSTNPEALAGFYARVMGLQLSTTSTGIHGETTGRRISFLPGNAKTLAFAGFAVPDDVQLSALTKRLDSNAVSYDRLGEGTEWLRPGAISVKDPDGNSMQFGIARGAQPPSTEGMIARLQHIVVASPDALRLKEFYQKCLGFQLSDTVVDEHSTLKVAFLRCSEEHHSFAVFQASTSRLDHHCYEAGDWNLIRDWGDHFADEGIKVEWGPGRHGPGNNLFLFVHDLDDNWMEISAELETVAQDKPAGVWPHEQRTLNTWGSAPLRS